MYLIKIFLFSSLIFASGGYDHGTSAGKGRWDISLTFNPFNYFEYGQSYMILGYGLTNKIDLQMYYSHTHNGSDNYYGGLLYQFFKSDIVDLSTAIGLRKYIENKKSHIFSPQLLYTFKLSKKLKIGGSFVKINDNKTKKQKKLDYTKDVFLMFNFYETKKYKLEITAGAFNPVLWSPKNGDWYPTYSIDIKIK